MQKEIYTTQKTETRFCFNSMILKIFSRYCHQLILFEIFNIKQEYKQTFNYYFSKEEILDLGKKTKEELIFQKRVTTNYDFQINLFKKNYKGIIDIECKLITKSTFENSYYSITINIIPDKDLKITPFFLTETGYNSLISEFTQKLWAPLLLQLTNYKALSKQKILTELNTVLSDYQLKQIISIDKNEDLVFDVFHIISSFCNDIKYKKMPLIITTDNIMQTRGLAQSPNTKGFRSGYKVEQKEKIQAAINILNKAKLINATELSPYKYLITLGKNLPSRKINTYPIKLVQYNYKTQIWERRFAHYLLTTQSPTNKINKLTNIITDQTSSFKPSQIREKFELTLDRLCEDNIIKSWHYAKINENEMTGKNWIEKWQKLSIICRY